MTSALVARSAGDAEGSLDEASVLAACAEATSAWDLRGRRVLCLTPDRTRTAPMDVMFRVLHALIAPVAASFDVLVALGTHPPLNDDDMAALFGLSPEDRNGRYAGTRFFNHDWRDMGQLVRVGTLTEDDVAHLSGGLLRERVDVTVNRLALEYDVLLVVGPTFPHEVVGFSGGNKYLFPGIAGGDIIDFFHWLGALVTSPAIIGTKHTPVRAVVDRAAAMLPVERRCISLVVGPDRRLAGLYAGSAEEAWSAAADHSARLHVRYEPRAYESVLSCAPPMYDELWVGGKCAYKLEPVVADGGELIIFAPHITRISATHGDAIRRVGYHVRDYFLADPARFSGVSRGVLAHSTHVKGAGTYERGVERPRIRVTLATGIGEDECRAVNLGFRDFRNIDLTAWRNGSRSDRLLVPRAGEVLHRLANGGAAPVERGARAAGAGGP